MSVALILGPSGSGKSAIVRSLGLSYQYPVFDGDWFSYRLPQEDGNFWVFDVDAVKALSNSLSLCYLYGWGHNFLDVAEFAISVEWLDVTAPVVFQQRRRRNDPDREHDRHTLAEVTENVENMRAKVLKTGARTISAEQSFRRVLKMTTPLSVEHYLSVAQHAQDKGAHYPEWLKERGYAPHPTEDDVTRRLTDPKWEEVS